MIGALLLLASATPVESFVYHCDNAADQTRFALTFQRRGARLSNVTVGHFGLPRILDDVETRWRGEMANGTARFRFRGRRPEQTGAMRLEPHPQRQGMLRLTWNSRIGGSDIPLQSEERAADCTRYHPEQANPVR